MSGSNEEYDFKWCPGCGDFGVRRALEWAMTDYLTEEETPMEMNVVVAGIGCSGNLVHLLEGDQPYGFHGIHGRSLPVAMGVKMARPELNVVVVAGDGDFLSIGMEHIAPQAARNPRFWFAVSGCEIVAAVAMWTALLAKKTRYARTRVSWPVAP